jgi:diguanylate cyclase (GGDEF)-like protein
MPNRSVHDTALIQRVLTRRATKLPTAQDGTTATVSVMLRVLPPPKTLIAIGRQHVQKEFEARITADMLDVYSVADDRQATQALATEFRAVVITDSLELIRGLCAGPAGPRIPYIIYVSELDEAPDRELGLAAGADETVARRASPLEIETRLTGARRIVELESVLRITMEENRRLSATDDLTQVASRRFFVKHFPREIERAARCGRGLSIIVCDIDNFRKLNEIFGHPGGDEVLRQFGPRLQSALRVGIDWVARIGGEEFAIVLPETSYAEAWNVARQLRKGISRNPFNTDKQALRVTASFGLCSVDRVSADARRVARRMMKIADAALYRSKHDGRNRVTGAQLGAAPSRSAGDIELTG